MSTSNATLRRYERLFSISRELASTLDLPRLLANTVHSAAEISNAEAASILLVDPNTNELRFETATNLDPSQSSNIVVPKASIAGWIAEHNQALIIPDVLQDSRFYQEVDSQTAFITRSILGVPITHNNRCIGVLEALNKTAGEQFTQADQHLLEVLAANAAVAIINTRLFNQSDLMAEMVHEIRTPLNSLTAATHLLTHPNLPPETRSQMAETMRSELERLNEITTRFLDLARLESGRMNFDYRFIDCTELAEECIRVVAHQAQARRISLICVLPPDFPRLWADPNRLKQVLLNLLTNAIKYNHEGGQIFIEGRQRPGNKLTLSVRDTGPGIPPEALPNLFERYYRVERDENRAQGTGLGLAIVRRIVEAHSGQIGVESQLGVGTTFHLHFTNPKSSNKPPLLTDPQQHF